MRVTESDFRQLAHSIKFMEYYWSRYQRSFPEEAAAYLYRNEINYFVSHDQYSQFLDVKESLFKRGKLVKREDYQAMKAYSRICQHLKMTLTSLESGDLFQ